MLSRGHTNSAHAGGGEGGVSKMRADACVGEGEGFDPVRAHSLEILQGVTGLNILFI